MSISHGRCARPCQQLRSSWQWTWRKFFCRFDATGGKNRGSNCGNYFAAAISSTIRSEEHTSELQSPCNLVCRLLLEKKNNKISTSHYNYYKVKFYTVNSILTPRFNVVPIWSPPTSI